SAVLFSTVAEEVARVLGVEMATVDTYDADSVATVLASFQNPGFPVGSRWPLEPGSIADRVFGSGRGARIDDYSSPADEATLAAHAAGITSAACAPITVEGKVWGLICVATRNGALPEGTEERLYGFTELVATAVSNAAAREDLIASRARIVAAGDEARRRIER